MGSFSLLNFFNIFLNCCFQRSESWPIGNSPTILNVCSYFLQTLYCLRFYRGDDKIRSFIWELITPREVEDAKSAQANSPKPIGSKRKRRLRESSLATGATTGKVSESQAAKDIDHWSREDKYDGDIFLENTYRKHLSRHANKWVVSKLELDCKGGINR